MKKSELKVKDDGLEINCECGRDHRVTQPTDGSEPVLETIYREPDGSGPGAPAGSAAEAPDAGTGPAEDSKPAGSVEGSELEKIICDEPALRILGFRFRHCRPECEAGA